MNHPHKCGTSVLETEWYGDIAEAPEWSDESCFDFVRSIQTDLMIPGIGVQKGQSLTPRSRVDNLVDTGERKMIFRAGPIDMLEINAHAK